LIVALFLILGAGVLFWSASVGRENVPSLTFHNTTTGVVVVTYVHPGGEVASDQVVIDPGRAVTDVGIMQANAQSGCLPGTLVASQDGREIDQLSGACSGATWEIRAPAPSG
jgi:hypothetical protein